MGETPILVGGLHGGQSTPKLTRNQPFTAVYSLYSVLIVTFFLVMSPYLAWQAVRHRKYIGSLQQRLGYLPISFNLDGEESIWIHAVSVGEVLTARALLPQLKERYPRLRLYLSTTTMTGQQIARNSLQYVDEVFYFPVRPGLRRQPDAAAGEAAAVHHDGDRDLAEPPAGPATARASARCWSTAASRRDRIRATVWRGRSSAACYAHRSLLHAGGGVGPPDHRDGRGSRQGGRDRQPEVRLAGHSRRRDRRRPRPQPRPPLFPDQPRPAGHHRRQHAERGRRAGVRGVPAHSRPGAGHAAGHRAAQARAVRRGGAAGAPRPGGRRRAAASCRSTPSRARTSSCSTPSASSRSSIRSPRRCSSAAASSTPAATTSWSPPSSASRSSSAPTCRTSPRSRATFVENDAAIQIKSARELEHALLGLLNDPVRRARLGAAARALVEANRGARGKTMAAIARVLPPQDSGNVRPFRVVH